MKDLSLVQEYMICAVNEKGGIPSFSTEKLVCLVAAGLLDLRLAGCLAIEGKKVQTTSPLPENRAYLGSLYEFVGDKPKALEKIVEAYTYSVTDKRLVRLMEDVGRSLADLGLAQDEARDSGLTLEVLGQALANCADLEGQGLGDRGTQALIHHYQNPAGR